jgi:hypothetical protein
MASLITNPSEFNASTDLMYGAPKPYGPGKKVPVMSKKTKRGLVLRCPWMMTYGANGYVNPKDPSGEPDMNKVSLSLQFPREEFHNDNTREFLQTMKDIEEQILNDAFKHCRDWLNTPYEDVREMKALYTPILKYPKDKATQMRDKTRPPTIQVKIPLDDKTKTYRTEVFNVSRTQLYPNEDDVSIVETIPPQSMVACNLYCAGVWIAGGKFGVIWNLSQAMVKPSEGFKKGECYIPAVDEDGNPIGESDVPSSPKEEEKPSNHDSDGEDEPPQQAESSPVVEEPEPVKEAPKKKAVKKGGKEV